MAAFALTDKVVINALDAAQQRGVVVRIALDPREHHDFLALGDLADTVRVKRSGPLMHLKAYEIDSAVLRTGSANFSVSGETAQDNDLVVIRRRLSRNAPAVVVPPATPPSRAPVVRYQSGRRIATALAEPALNSLVARRMVKKQQMQW
jgi:phosphatidylserine/phosphatidylglycerophosphate/cardiolipin synthase-like enzyme